MTHFIQNGVFHADPNPGNYLVLSDDRLGVVDFGCIKTVAPTFPQQLQTLFCAHLAHNKDLTREIYAQLGVIPKVILEDSQKFDSAIAPFQSWIILPFQSQYFDFGQHPNYIGSRLMDSLQSAMTAMDNTTSDFVMFDRTYIGILSLLIKLKARVKMQALLDAAAPTP